MRPNNGNFNNISVAGDVQGALWGGADSASAVERPASPMMQSAPRPITQVAYPAPGGVSESCPTGACTADGCICGNCPIRGPNDEYLCDGGDFGVPAGVRADYTVQGLEQEDAVAHYDTVDGRTVVTPSNKVCIYAPRFGAVRRVVDAVGYTQSAGPVGLLDEMAAAKAEDRGVPIESLADVGPYTNRRQQPASLLEERLMPAELDRDQSPMAAVGAVAPVANLTLIATGEVVGSEGAEVARLSLAAVTWAGDQAPQVVLENEEAIAAVSVVSPGTVYHLKEPNSPKLRLIKLASTGAAQPGDEVEFTLRFDNIGDREVERVTIVDNLTTRLQYVADSQESTLDASFVSDQNDGGSLVLKWQLAEPLEPGKGGVITFRCKVR